MYGASLLLEAETDTTDWPIRLMYIRNKGRSQLDKAQWVFNYGKYVHIYSLCILYIYIYTYIYTRLMYN